MAIQIEHIHGRSILQGLSGNKMNQEPLALEVVVAKHCQQCRQSLQVADALQKEFPALKVRVVDLDAPDAVKPDAVFAVPSYLLNGRVVSLGNPEVEEISGTIRALLQAREVAK
jgi:predicted thioredoxin/glutaredoxin